MPRATAIKIKPNKKPKSLRAGVVVGVALIIALIGAWRLHGPAASTTPAIASVPSIPAGMSQADATAIPSANNWRLLQEADSDPALGQCSRDHQVVPTARISRDVSYRGTSRDVVYLLADQDAA